MFIASALPAGAGQALRMGQDVSHLARHAVRAAVDAPIDHNGAADARAVGEAQKVALADTRAKVGLAQRCGVHIVLYHDRNARMRP